MRQLPNLAAALGPHPVLAEQLGHLAHSSRGARHPLHPSQSNLWEVAAWEIAHLEFATWEVALGKMS